MFSHFSLHDEVFCLKSYCMVIMGQFYVNSPDLTDKTVKEGFVENSDPCRPVAALIRSLQEKRDLDDSR